jgi:DNA-binding response OmpR family regulator
LASQLTLDRRDRHVAFDERRVPLTETEFDLLANLMKMPGRVFRREELLARVWSSPRIQPRTVDVNMARLRA